MTTTISLDLVAAAEACGVKERTIRDAIRAGKLRAKRSARNAKGDGVGKYLIAPEDLKAWFEGLPDA